jgi:hypothetical protein
VEHVNEQDIGNAYKNIVRKPGVKRPFGKRRCKWEVNSKMGLREIRCDDVD